MPGCPRVRAWCPVGCPVTHGLSEGPAHNASAASPVGPGLEVPSMVAGVSKVPGTLLLHLFPQMSCKDVLHLVLKSGGGG